MSHWFEDWFDSEYYHILYRHRDRQEAEYFLDNLVQKLQLRPNSRILDLACGKGRHSLYLSRKGFSVTGADLSENNIRYATQHPHENLRFIVHDMRSRLPANSFDVVLNLFTSFGYFDCEKDDLRALQSAADALVPDGLLVIDFFNALKVSRELTPEAVTTENDITFRIKRSIAQGFVVKQVSFSDKGRDYSYIEKVRLLTPDDFKRLLDATGLQIINTFGDYALQPFDLEQSERFILVAGKK